MGPASLSFQQSGFPPFPFYFGESLWKEGSSSLFFSENKLLDSGKKNASIVDQHGAARLPIISVFL
jgi:hypothetical protein